MTKHRLKCLVASATIAVLLATPIGIGLVFATSPSVDTASTGFVAHLSEIPADGIPHRYAVSVSHHNAWSLGAPQVVDHIFLRRFQDTSTMTALSASHSPGLNIPVLFHSPPARFVSVCWRVEFDSDGRSLAAGIDDLQQIPVLVAEDAVMVRLDSVRPTHSGR